MKIFLARGGCLARDVTEEFRRAFGIRGEISEECAAELIREAEGRLEQVPGIDPGGGWELAAAPDEAFEGWGIGSDGSFLRPVPPPGWRYDERTGTFYRICGGTGETGGDKTDKTDGTVGTDKTGRTTDERKG